MLNEVMIVLALVVELGSSMKGWLEAGVTFRLDPGIISECITSRNCLLWKEDGLNKKDPGINE